MLKGRAAAEAYVLAFEEAGRALEGQERAVAELRQRASVLLAAAAVVTSFLGGAALPVGGGVPAVGWAAITAFVLLGMSVLAILWPRADWEFTASPARLIDEYFEPEDEQPLPVHLVHRDLALHRSASADRNAVQLGRSYRLVRVGLVLLVLEVGAWLVALGTQS